MKGDAISAGNLKHEDLEEIKVIGEVPALYFYVHSVPYELLSDASANAAVHFIRKFTEDRQNIYFYVGLTLRSKIVASNGN